MAEKTRTERTPKPKEQKEQPDEQPFRAEQAFTIFIRGDHHSYRVVRLQFHRR